MNLKSSLLFVLAVMVISSTSWAIRPAVAYTEAIKFDSSFNEAVFREGVTPYKARHGADLVEADPSSPSEFVDVLISLAEQQRSPIVAVGFSYADAVKEVAPQYPDLQFVIIDSVVELPNVQSIVFKEHEGSFLVGALAALTNDGNDFGFIGGIDLDFIRRFGCGYAQGIHYINKRAKIHSRYVAQDFSGFGNIPKGHALAEELIGEGVKVIYAAAGGSGNGAYEAAAQHSDVYAIGVDSNQNFLHVGTMLTSMVKKVGIAALGSWEEALNGQWTPGVKSMGVAENGVDWQLDIFNRNLVSKSVEKKINKIREDIISGKLKVVDYVADGQCPVAM